MQQTPALDSFQLQNETLLSVKGSGFRVSWFKFEGSGTQDPKPARLAPRSATPGVGCQSVLPKQVPGCQGNAQGLGPREFCWGFSLGFWVSVLGFVVLGV